MFDNLYPPFGKCRCEDCDGCQRDNYPTLFGLCLECAFPKTYGHKAQ